MANVGLRNVVDRLRRGLREPTTDGDLLDRFVNHRDEAAFAELVERHGPKVYAVCRRVLGPDHLAEDAYQATFVVLAKKAHTIHPRSAVGGFLYGVARKAALRTYAVTRRRKETLVDRVPDTRLTEPSETDSDVLVMLDEEIANLTETLRAAVVLCELDGVSRAEAAKQLGIAEGTLSSRLAAARKQLGTKLKARGVTFSASLFTALASSATAAGPPILDVATASVSTIAGGVLRTMLLAKLKMTSVVGVLIATILGLSGLVPKGGHQAVAAPVPKVVGQTESLLVISGTAAGILDSNGQMLGLLHFGGTKPVQRFRVSPDGRRIAYLRSHTSAKKLGGDQSHQENYRKDIFIADLPLTKPPQEPAIKGVIDPTFAWAADSNSLFVSSLPEGTPENPQAVPGKHTPQKTIRFEIGTKTSKDVELPSDHGVLDASRDGKVLLTWTRVLPKQAWQLVAEGEQQIASYLVPLDTLKPKMLGEENDCFPAIRLSPDGTRILCIKTSSHKTKEKGLFIYEIASEKWTKVEFEQLKGEHLLNAHTRWSPDGKRIAVLWHEGSYSIDHPTDVTYRVTTVDSDGKNAKTIRVFDKKQEFSDLDWATARLGELPKAEPAKPAEKPKQTQSTVTPVEKPKQPIAAPPKPNPGMLLLARDTGFVTLTPEGKEGVEITLPKGSRSAFQSSLSPDGTRVASVVDTSEPRTAPSDDPWKFRVLINKIGTSEPIATADFLSRNQLTICWSPDGKKVIVTSDPNGDNDVSRQNDLVDAATGKIEAVELPANVRVLDWSSDGKTLLVLHREDKTLHLGLATLGGKSVQKLIARKSRFDNGLARLSPDGKKILFTDADPEQKDACKWDLSSKPYLFDMTTQQRQPLAEFPQDARCGGIAWSPDGKRVAYTWMQLHADLLKMDTMRSADRRGRETEAFLIIADADGKNAKTVKSAKAANAHTPILGTIDWR